MTIPRSASRRTPIDHDYGTCDRTCAELLIYYSRLGHEAVTELLGLEPTSSQNQGDEIRNSIGRTRIAKVTMWALSSEPFVSSKDVRAHLDWLLERLSSSHEALRDLQQGGAKMGVSCPWWSRGGHGGPTLWPEQMQQLADLNLECSFDVQFFPDDDATEEGRGGSTF